MGRIKGKKDTWVDEGFKVNTFNLMRGEGEIRELLPEDEVKFLGLSRKYFEKRNVYENRVLAQKIGIEAATTLPKKQLVDSLINKVWGLQTFTKGYKETTKVDINKIMPEIELDILEDIKCAEVIIGEEVEGVFYHTEIGSSSIGGLIYDVSMGFKDAIADTCVLRNIVGEHNLKDGDHIVGRVKYYPQLEFYCLIKIDSINGNAVTLPMRPELSVKPVKPSQKLELTGEDRIVLGLNLFAPVCHGQFGLISTAGRMEFSTSAIEIYKAVNKKNCDCKLFLLDEKEVVYEQCAKFAENNEIYFTGIGQPTTDLKKILQYMDLQAREAGKKEVLIINDIDKLALPSEVVAVAREISSYAGAYDNGGSLTIIAFSSTSSPFGTYFILRNNLDFELSLKVGSDITQTTMDVMSSYSFSIREQDKDETIALAKLKQYALTAGISAAERLAISCGGNTQRIINQLDV